MSSEWPVLALEDCLDALIDYRGKTPTKTDSGVPLVTAKVIKAGRIETPTEFIAEQDFDSWMRRGMPEPGDVVMTTEAPLGEVAQLGRQKVALAQRVITLRGKAGFLDNDYLLYLMMSEEMQDQLKARATGTTVLGIKQSELRKISLKVPPVAIQRAAASILKALDDRIALLRETNATLEAIAQALFKSWFVDFDPVHANAAFLENGQVPSLPAEIQALFPSCLVESPQGLIPEGWEVCTIADVTETLGGATPNTKNEEFWNPPEVSWTSPKDLSGLNSPVFLETERKISKLGLSKISSGLLPIGTLLMSSRAPIGYLAMAQVPLAINQGYIAMPPGGKLPPLFMLYWCRQNMEVIENRANGSTFMEISKKAFRPIEIILPPRTVVDAFMATAETLFDRLVENEKQIRSLSDLRDTLLPRLISGQLRLLEVV